MKPADRRLKTAIIVLAALVAVGVVFIWMGDMDYYTVTDVRLSTDRGVVPDTMRAVGDSYIGRNILRCTKKDIEARIMDLGYVSAVQVEKMHPNAIVIDATLNDYSLRLQTSDSDSLYLAGDDLDQVSRETWDIYAYAPTVTVNSSYASMLHSWGLDNGFVQMERLVESLYGENLITSIKYDNNNTGYFGRLVIVLDSIQATVTVTDPVEPERLLEALGIVESRQSESEGDVRYELTSTSLSW